MISASKARSSFMEADTERTLGTGIKDTVGSRDFHRGDDHGTASILILIVADIDYFLALKNHCHRERVKAAPIDCVFFQHADVKSGNSFPIQVMGSMAFNCLIYEFFCYFFSVLYLEFSMVVPFLTIQDFQSDNPAP